MKFIKAGKWLACGCCGCSFDTWEGYKDQDQDNGYGICRSCQGDISQHDSAEMDKAIACFKDGLKQENQAAFALYNRADQEAMVMMAIDKGFMKFNVVRA